MIFREYPLGDGFWGRECDRNTCKNLIKRTILSFAKGNSCQVFVTGSMGLDRDLSIRDERIPL
jgi:hypothetical protein